LRRSRKEKGPVPEEEEEEPGLWYYMKLVACCYGCRLAGKVDLGCEVLHEIVNISHGL
jgi:hypothetical protein